LLSFATVTTCKKNLASAIGHVESGLASVAALHVALSAVVFACKQISCDKKAPVLVAFDTVILFNFNVDANLGTITMFYTECWVLAVTDVASSETLACNPTV